MVSNRYIKFIHKIYDDILEIDAVMGTSGWWENNAAPEQKEATLKMDKLLNDIENFE